MAEAARVKPKAVEADAVRLCLSASRDTRTHARAHTSNLTGRFARGNLKCKTETRERGYR